MKEIREGVLSGAGGWMVAGWLRQTVISLTGGIHSVFCAIEETLSVEYGDSEYTPCHGPQFRLYSTQRLIHTKELSKS